MYPHTTSFAWNQAVLTCGKFKFCFLELSGIFLPLNIFNTQLIKPAGVKATDVKPMNMEGQLYWVHYQEQATSLLHLPKDNSGGLQPCSLVHNSPAWACPHPFAKYHPQGYTSTLALQLQDTWWEWATKIGSTITQKLLKMHQLGENQGWNLRCSMDHYSCSSAWRVNIILNPTQRKETHPRSYMLSCCMCVLKPRSIQFAHLLSQQRIYTYLWTMYIYEHWVYFLCKVPEILM